MTVPDTCDAGTRPGERFDQLGLAVAFDAGDADDFAGAHVERHVVQAPRAIARRSTDRSRTLSTTAPGFAAGFSTRSSTSRPTISRASSAALVSLVLTLADDRAVAHHRHVIGDRQHLRQLVRDDDDRLALLAHAPQDGEELVDFLRREHRGRLVENQQLRAPVERLQQLDALLLADRQRLDDARSDRRRA